MMRGSRRARNKNRHSGWRQKRNPYWKRKGATPRAGAEDDDGTAAPTSTRQSGGTKKQYGRPRPPPHTDKKARLDLEPPPAAARTEGAEDPGEREDPCVAQGGVGNVASRNCKDEAFGWEPKRQSVSSRNAVADPAPMAVELFLPQHCHLNAESKDLGRVMDSQPEKRQIKRLLAKTGLRMPVAYIVSKPGAVCLRSKSGLLVSCLLFHRDKASEFVKIFDIVRLATEPEYQRKGHATRCLKTFIHLLRRNFPHGSILVRAGVLKNKNAGAFYANKGFTKGGISGLSNPYYGRRDCDAYFLEPNGPRKIKKTPPAESKVGKGTNGAKAKPRKMKKTPPAESKVGEGAKGAKAKPRPLFVIEAFVSKPSPEKIKVKWVGKCPSLKSEEELRRELDPLGFARLKGLLDHWPSRAVHGNGAVSASDLRHDSECMVCNDGGDLICCETCPCVAHPSCVRLKRTSHRWRCAICRHRAPKMRLCGPNRELCDTVGETEVGGDALAQPREVQANRPSAAPPTPSKQVYQKIKLGRARGYPVAVAFDQSEHVAILMDCDDNPHDFLREHSAGNVKVRWESTRRYDYVPTKRVSLIQIDAALPVRKAAGKASSTVEMTKEVRLEETDGAGGKTPPGSQPKRHQPKVDVFCSRHSKLTFNDEDFRDANVSVAEAKDSNIIESLLERDLKVKTSWISLRRRPCQLDCYLLFERDNSTAGRTRIYDIARLDLENGQQCYADATLCLDVFATLLRKNLPRDKIIVRAAAFKWAQSFYEAAGFVKGLPQGLSEGQYCGYRNCSTFHLIVQDCSNKSYNKRGLVVGGNEATSACKMMKLMGGVTSAADAKVPAHMQDLEGNHAKAEEFSWEEEYLELCNYYLKSVTRKSAELPSGMVLRSTEVSPNLTRYKNSEFRLRLDKKITYLERLGDRKEVHRILKMLYDHDRKCHVGGNDGPKELMDEIFPPGTSGVEVLSEPFEENNEVCQHRVDSCSVGDDSMNDHGNGASLLDAANDVKPELCFSANHP